MLKNKKRIIGVISGGIVISLGIIWLIIGLKPQDSQTANEDVVQHESANEADTIDTMNPDNLHIEPDIAGEQEGIDRETTFTLTHNFPLEENEVLNNLTIEPMVKFTVETINNTKMKLSLDKELPGKSLVKFRYDDGTHIYGQGFMTTESFRIRYIYPLDGEDPVSLSSGIEVSFSREVDSTVFNNIHLSPEVDATYQLSSDKMMVRIIPKYGLQPETDYQVMVDDGIVMNEETLEEGKSWSFHTSHMEEDLNLVIGEQWLNTVNISEVPLVKCRFQNDEQVDVTLYPLNEESIREALMAKSTLELKRYIDEKRVGDAFETVINPMTSDDWWQIGEFDQVPKAGVYIAQYGYENNQYRLIQFTDYTGYITMDDDSVFMWMQHPEYNLEKCDVTINGALIGSLDEEGMLSEPFDVQEETNYIASVETGTGKVYLPFTTEQEQYNADTVYYSYLYTDRSIYLPTDTIEVFGFIKERVDKPVETVRVELSYHDLILESKEMTLDTIGSFKTSFHIDNYLNDLIRVEVIVNDTYTKGETLSVGQFEKPLYKLDASIQEDYIESGNPVHIDVGQHYYSGTPVSDSKFELGYDNYRGFSWETNAGDAVEKEIITGSEGLASLTRVPINSSTNWRPSTMRFDVHSLNNQQYYSSERDYIAVFSRDRMIEGALSEGEGQLILDGTAHAIDLNNITTSVYDPNSFRGKAVSEMELNVQVQEEYWEKVVTGSTYSPLYKRTIEEYTQNKIEKIIFDDGVTTDEKGIFTLTVPEINPDHVYKVTVSGNDTKGRKIVETLYYSGRYSGEGDKEYRLIVEESQYEMAVGETARMKLAFDGELVEVDPDRQMLVLVIKDGIKEAYVTTDTSLEYTFKFEDMPDVLIQAFYYDGTRMIHTYNMENRISIQDESRALRMDIDFDKQQYRPGDTVSYSLHVKDAKGVPKKADVNMSVVDEAVFAIYEDYSNPNEDLFDPIYRDMIYGSYLMSPSYEMNFGAEQGGEGGPDSMRDDLDNTAYFDIVQTNGDGDYEGRFTLPDNITDWRVTLTGVTSDIYAGKTTASVIATLPIFLTATVEDSFLEEDAIGVTLNTAGTIENSGQAAQYKVKVLNEDEEVVYEGEVKSRYEKETSAMIGALPVGSYELHSEVTIDPYSDYVVHPFKVKKQVATYPLVQESQLTKESSFITNNQSVTVELFNKDAYTLYKQYSMLVSYDKNSVKGVIGDLAKITRNQLFSVSTGNPYLDSQSFMEEGLFKTTEEQPGDLLLSARMAAVDAYTYMQDYRTERGIKSVEEFVNHGKNLDSVYIGCIWLGQQLGMDFYEDIREVEMNYDAITTLQGKVNAIRAFIEIGDLTVANVFYHDLLDDYDLSQQRIGDSKTRLSEDKETDEWLASGLLAIATDLKDWKRAEVFYKYITYQGASMSYHYNFLMPDIEVMYYLNHKELPELESEVDLKAGDYNEHLILRYNTRYSKTFTAKEAEAFAASNIKGNTTMVAHVTAFAKDLPKVTTPRVRREITGMDGSTSFTVGERVRVTLTITREAGQEYFTIREPLPAGINYMGVLNDAPHMSFSSDNITDELNMSLSLGQYFDKSQMELSVTYIGYATLPGTYEWEPTYVKSMYDHVEYVSDKQTVRIEE